MTIRDKRAVQLGLAAVLGALLLLRVIPWGVRRAAAAERELAANEELLARTQVELADQQPLTDSVAQVTQAGVALAPRILSGGVAAAALADPPGRVHRAATPPRARVDRPR